MKSSRKSIKRINNYEVYPKNGIAQTIMYQNMSSHYRRIYNAKPRIDTGPPFSHKPKPRLQTKHFNMSWNKKEKEYFVPKENEFNKNEKEYFVPKQNESNKKEKEYFVQNQNEFNEKENEYFVPKQNESNKKENEYFVPKQNEFNKKEDEYFVPKQNEFNKKENEYFVPKQNESTVSLNSSKCSRQGCGDIEVPTFKPLISRTHAESKLRGLRVYHPPRRRVYSSSDTSIQLIKSSPEISVPDIPWIRGPEGDVKTTPSKESSSDSAYTEEGEGMWSGGESRGPTPVSDTHTVSSSENLMYVKFVRDITEEVLEKGVFTNKALKQIFHNHIEANKPFLDMRRMQEEVEKLQLELGIPTDDNLDMGYGATYKTSNKKNNCSKMEDKELLDALSQLNISSSLKADIADSLGLFSKSESGSIISVSSSDDSIKHTRNSKHATFSTPLEVIYDINQKEKFSRQKFPQSDDDSYEMLSEGSESRPLTPLGLAW